MKLLFQKKSQYDPQQQERINKLQAQLEEEQRQEKAQQAREKQRSIEKRKTLNVINSHINFYSQRNDGVSKAAIKELRAVQTKVQYDKVSIKRGSEEMNKVLKKYNRFRLSRNY